MPKARAVAPAAYINIPLTAVHVRKKQAVFQQLVKDDLQGRRTSAPFEGEESRCQADILAASGCRPRFLISDAHSWSSASVSCTVLES